MEKSITLTAVEAQEVIDLLLEAADHIEDDAPLSKDFVGIVRTWVALLDDRLYPDG